MAGVAAFRTIHSYAFNTGLVNEIYTEVTGDGDYTRSTRQQVHINSMYTDKGALVSEAMLKAHVTYLDGLPPDFLSYEEYNL